MDLGRADARIGGAGPGTFPMTRGRWLAAGRPGGPAAATARMAAIKRTGRARTIFDAGGGHGEPVAPCADRPT
jgi:hypothetical protein